MSAPLSEPLKVDRHFILIKDESSKWANKDLVSHCTKCRDEFSFFDNKSHCRVCGMIFHRICNPERNLIIQGSIEIIRVCDPCYEDLKGYADAPPIPEKSVLDIMFERFMDDQYMKPAQREAMRMLPPDKQWFLISSLKVKTKVDAKYQQDTPETWISILKDTFPKSDQLKTLKIVMQGAFKPWLVSFGSEGLSLLRKVISDSLEKPQTEEITSLQIEAVGCLKCWMNNEYGLDIVMQDESTTKALVSLLTMNSDALKISVFTLLCVIAWVSEAGLNFVYDGMETLKKWKNMNGLFDPLVGFLQTSNNIDFLQTVMTFINVLVNSCNTLERRALIRHELESSEGYFIVFEKLSSICASHVEESYSGLQAQLSVFQSEKKSDARETIRNQLDLSETSAVFRFLNHSTREDNYSAQLLTILQTLLCIPDDYQIADAIWDNLVQITRAAIIGVEQPTEVIDDDSDFTSPKSKTRIRRTSMNPDNTTTIITSEEIVPGPFTYEKLKALLEHYETQYFSNHIRQKEVFQKQIVEEGKKFQEQRVKTEALVESLKEKDIVIQNLENQCKQIIEKPLAAAVSKSSDLETITKLQNEVNELKLKLSAAASSVAPIVPIVSIPMSVGPPKIDGPPISGPPSGLMSLPPSGLISGPPSGLMSLPPSGLISGPPSGLMSLPPSGLISGPPSGLMSLPPTAGGPPKIGGPPGAPPVSIPTGPKLPPKRDFKPAVSMRAFHWTTIPTTQVESTLWKTLTDESIVLDWKDIEKKFGIEKKDCIISIPLSSPKSGAAVGFGKAITRLLETNKGNNIEIALSRFKMTHIAIKDSILKLDTVLTADKVSQLIKLLPTPEEASMLNDFDGDRESLGNAEKFYSVLLTIPKLDMRLNMFQLKYNFDSQAEELEASLDSLENALSGIKQSKKFQSVLQTTLALGNYINGGTPRGQAYGFKINTITKLANTKTTDNKMNLLLYLITILKEHNKDALQFTNDFVACEKASKIDTTFIKGEISKLTGNFTLLENELKNMSESATDKFKPIMAEFGAMGIAKTLSMMKRIDAVFKLAADLIKLYGEREGTKPEEFIKIFDEFSTQEGQKELERIRVQAEKEAAKKALEDAKAKKLIDGNSSPPEVETKKNLFTPPKSFDKPAEKDIVDNLMGSLKQKDSNLILDEIRKKRLNAPDISSQSLEKKFDKDKIISRGHHQIPSQLALSASMLKKLKSMNPVDTNKTIIEGDENSPHK